MIHRFFTDFTLIAADAFRKFVNQVADRDLLDNTFRVDSTDVQAAPADEDATWNYDPTGEADDTEGDADEDEDNGDDDDSYYDGYGCTVVSTGQKIPIATAITHQKQVDQETARRVTREASRRREADQDA